ncbi:MAG: hypothetical protein GYA14_04160 [Ignavibacteria bacterium]|nr:hypothetical protein [Ignavibacteria bacterium]
MTNYSFSTPFIYDVNSITYANVTFIGASGGSPAIDSGSLVGILSGSTDKYQKYDDSSVPTASGILLTKIPALAEGATATGTILIGGAFVLEQISEKDVSEHYITDLGARKVVLDSSKTILIF